MSTEPTLAEIIRLALDSRLADVHVALPAVVDSYDASTQTVTATPAIARPLEDLAGDITYESLPPIPNIPVAFPQSAAFTATWPLAQGDKVLLVFCSSAIGEWQTTGEPSEPTDLRRHDLSNAVAYPGLSPDNVSLPTAADAALLEVSGPATHVQVGAGAADFVVLEQKLMTAFNAHTHPTPSGPSSPPTTPLLVGDTGATKLKSE